jgi:hypothetical protein
MESQLELLPQIEKLRRDLLWTKYIAAILFVLLAAASLASWTKRSKTIEANEFLVKDRAGKIVARLGHNDFGDTCLTLTAQQSVSVANLCVQDSEGSSLDLHNLKSDSRATLTPGFNTYEPAFHFQPALIINQAMNADFANINVGAESKFVMGQDSKNIVSISSGAEDPKIVLYGPNEKLLWANH